MASEHQSPDKSVVVKAQPRQIQLLKQVSVLLIHEPTLT